MRSLLVINPNMSSAVSALLQRHAHVTAGQSVRVRTLTAQFGAPYISSEASYAIAGHATLDAWARANADVANPFDAVLIGCFGDPGLLALRECSTVPVTGLAEAAFVEASRGGRFAVVTGGARWKPMLERLAHNLGFGAQLAGIHTVEQSGGELARDPVAAHSILTRACEQAATLFDASVVILGGAGLAGMADPIAAALQMPVIDSVAAGVRYALAGPPVNSEASGHFDFAWSPHPPTLPASAN
jgi:Asp/Glu/hydantoin racemase